MSGYFLVAVHVSVQIVCLVYQSLYDTTGVIVNFTLQLEKGKEPYI